ncbi:alpha/beta fold hydrolase [Planctomonas psychrotolerans]|uniref:alpha/beta fold hydrolase n=1 Tax=Planctomonas psychrotolerans TaxID=2528712 RepID=UPI00123C78ED|nr:alpha/beta fold hydrolase [Planctomonas psychrotolerans]
MPTYTDSYGVDITYYEWTVSEPRAVVQLVHGLGEHAQRYGALAEALSRAGYSVYAEDHRGHGQTGLAQHGGDLSRLGRLGPGGLRATFAAVHQFTALVRDANPGVPIVLLGHSFGSIIAQVLLNTHSADYAAVVLTGTAARLPGLMNGGDLNRLHKHLGTTGREWLTRDLDVQRAFDDDPLTFPADARKLFGLVDGRRLFGVPARNLPSRLPLLIQIGSEDSLGGERSVRRLADLYRRRSGLTDVQVQVYPEARHEVFNELNRDEVIGDLLAWLNAHIAH